VGLDDPVDGERVAVGTGDRQAEQVAQGSYVAAGGVGFVEDAVLADALAWHRQLVATSPGFLASPERSGESPEVDDL
jgi:uncharacterized membrane protein